jgi:hypothetical protein
MGEHRRNVELPPEAAEAAERTHATSRTRRRSATSTRPGDILGLLRRHGIPCWIDSFAAQGWTAKLGDPANGFYAQQSRFRTIDDAANWLLAEARRHRRDVAL